MLDTNVLVDTMARDADKVDRLIAALGRAFPEASVAVPPEVIASLELPDRDDRHVLAAAVVGECDWIVTENGRDFPSSALGRLDVLLAGVSETLVVLSARFHAEMPSIIEGVVGRLQSPAMTVPEWLQRLERRHALGAVGIGKAIGVDGGVGRLPA